MLSEEGKEHGAIGQWMEVEGFNSWPRLSLWCLAVRSGQWRMGGERVGSPPSAVEVYRYRRYSPYLAVSQRNVKFPRPTPATPSGVPVSHAGRRRAIQRLPCRSHLPSATATVSRGKSQASSSGKLVHLGLLPRPSLSHDIASIPHRCQRRQPVCHGVVLNQSLVFHQANQPLGLCHHAP
jgi:hypothetical protein